MVRTSLALRIKSVSLHCRIYAGELKDILGYNQTQIQGIMSPLFISAVVGWLPGILYDAFEPRHRLGPR